MLKDVICVCPRCGRTHMLADDQQAIHFDQTAKEMRERVEAMVRERVEAMVREPPLKPAGE